MSKRSLIGLGLIFAMMVWSSNAKERSTEAFARGALWGIGTVLLLQGSRQRFAP